MPPTTTAIDPTFLAPGAWARRAQAALDQLSTAATIDDAAERCGSARTLAVDVLGAPEFGGHATKPVIRSLGRLLQHPIGPALAAETLSLVASVGEMIDSDMVLLLLGRAFDRDTTCRPRRLDERFELTTQLGLARTRAERMTLMRSWMTTRPAVDRYWFPWQYAYLYSEPDDTFWDRAAACWLGNHSEPSVLIEEVFDLSDGAQQVRAYQQLPRWQRELVAEDPRLFDADDGLVVACLDEHPRLVVRNKSCPSELWYRVAHPYDLATLELAVRAGEGVAHDGRLRRLLSEQPDHVLRDLAERLPIALCAALRRVGLVKASMFVSGPLSGLDLANPSIVAAAFELRPDRHGTVAGPVEVLLGLLRDHPDAASLAAAAPYVLGGFHSIGRPLPLGTARDLAACGFDGLARAAYSLVRDSELSAAENDVLVLLGDKRAAAAAGIPAELRPVAAAYLGEASNVDSRPDHSERLEYEEQIRRLHGSDLRGWPGWRVHLFRNIRELHANARAMSNCTAGYAELMLTGRTVVLALVGPGDERLNASLERDGGRWVVTQVNSSDNAGNPHHGIDAALQAMANSRLAQPSPDPWESLDATFRRATPRRDNRRQQAAAARRRKR